MATRAGIAVQLETLNAAFAVFDGVVKPQTNETIVQFNDNRRATPSAQLDAVVAKFTALSLAITAAKAEVAAQIIATEALVPSDPPVVTFAVPPLALNAGGSVSIAEYYRGPAAVFTASGLPPGVMLNQSGLLDAAADAPDSVSTIALTATEQ